MSNDLATRLREIADRLILPNYINWYADSTRLLVIAALVNEPPQSQGAIDTIMRVCDSLRARLAEVVAAATSPRGLVCNITRTTRCAEVAIRFNDPEAWGNLKSGHAVEIRKVSQ